MRVFVYNMRDIPINDKKWTVESFTVKAFLKKQGCQYKSSKDNKIHYLSFFPSSSMLYNGDLYSVQGMSFCNQSISISLI